MPTVTDRSKRYMKSGRYLLLIVLVAVLASSAYPAGRAEFNAQVNVTRTKLSREGRVDEDAAMRLAGLLQSEYGTSIEDMKWAVDNSLSWGDISVVAYIAATTGHSFREIG